MEQTQAPLNPAPAPAPAPAAPVDLLTMPNMEMNLQTSHGFALVQRVASMLCMSTLVPKEYQGKGNLSNCIIALNMAYRLGADPLMVIQNLYVVHGRPGWSSQFLIATFNKSGKFSALRYQFVGARGQDDWGCFAYATELATGEVLQGTTVTMGTAKAEGWLSKSGSKWGTMPEQMFRYRAASWFIRAYAPEIAMGLLTAEELHDSTYDAAPDKNGTYAVNQVDLNDLVPLEPRDGGPGTRVFPEDQAPADSDLPGTVIGPEDPAPPSEPPFEAPADVATTMAGAVQGGKPMETQAPAEPAQELPKKNGRPKASEVEAAREAVLSEIEAKKIDLRVVERAVGEFTNRWGLKEIERVRSFIIPSLLGERRV